MSAKRTAPETPKLRRFLRQAAVVDITGLSLSTIYDKMRAGTFPKQVKLFGAHAKKSGVAWVEDEIVAWMNSKISARDEVA